MPYWGKIVGVAVGLLSGRPLFVVLGLILGHQFDRGLAEWRARQTASDDAHLNRLPEAFIRTLFQAMGAVAKADGRVSEDEIRAARAMMHRLGLKAVQVRHAIDWFRAGKARGFQAVPAVRDWKREGGASLEARQLLVRLLMEVALAKGKLAHRERTLLWSIASELGVGRVELAQLEAMLRAQRGFRDSPQGNADTLRLDAAYVTLGVEKSASNDDIKRAYRRLMNRNHPDKLVGSEVNPERLATAQKRTRDIRSAYEMLKARREIR